jgi:hypothetical protein
MLLLLFPYKTIFTFIQGLIIAFLSRSLFFKYFRLLHKIVIITQLNSYKEREREREKLNEMKLFIKTKTFN